MWLGRFCLRVKDHVHLVDAGVDLTLASLTAAIDRLLFDAKDWLRLVASGLIAFTLFFICHVLFKAIRLLVSDSKQLETTSAGLALTPNLDALARKHGIYIGPAGIAAQVIGDTLTVRLVIFTCTNPELRFIRVALSTGTVEIILESAEPQRIVPFMEFDKRFTKTLTAEEIRRVPNWANTVTINGKAKFEDHTEKAFSFGVALSRA
jgi:hypothetical protein